MSRRSALREGGRRDSIISESHARTGSGDFVAAFPADLKIGFQCNDEPEVVVGSRER